MGQSLCCCTSRMKYQTTYGMSWLKPYSAIRTLEGQGHRRCVGRATVPYQYREKPLAHREKKPCCKYPNILYTTKLVCSPIRYVIFCTTKILTFAQQPCGVLQFVIESHPHESNWLLIRLGYLCHRTFHPSHHQQHPALLPPDLQPRVQNSEANHHRPQYLYHSTCHPSLHQLHQALLQPELHWNCLRGHLCTDHAEGSQEFSRCLQHEQQSLSHLHPRQWHLAFPPCFPHTMVEPHWGR
mmetsp:Transcript_107615/g.181976  ORF Transcript_107615/g.181976 Transcript_107615/m.181976 type:complete len:240 (+) Transcript_107615:864-1583(+)